MEKIDPLLVVGLQAVQQRVNDAKRAHDGYIAEIFKRYGMDPKKNYHIADDGTVTEIEEKKSEL